MRTRRRSGRGQCDTRWSADRVKIHGGSLCADPALVEGLVCAPPQPSPPSCTRHGPGREGSSASPGAASGRRRPSPDCACLVDGADPGHDPCPGRGRLRIDGVGVFSSGGPIGQIHFSMGCDLLICCKPRSLRGIRVSRSGRACPRALARADMGRNRARPSHLIHSVRVGPAPRPPVQAGKGSDAQRPCASDPQDSAGRAAARGAAGRCAGCTHRHGRDAEAVRPGPARLAGRSITSHTKA